MIPIYNKLAARFDPQGFALLHAAENILGKKVTDPAMVTATGFDKLTVLMRDVAIPEDFKSMEAFNTAIHTHAIMLLNKKFLYILQDANNQLRNVWKRNYTCSKSHPLTKEEAQVALKFCLHVDAVSATIDYHGRTREGYTKTALSLKNLEQFYNSHDVDFEHCDEVAYLSADYEAAKCVVDDIMYALHYFMEKESAMKAANMEECPTLYIMIGMPGAGKSTLASRMNIESYSSDAIRKELTGSVSGITKGAVEFYLMNQRTKQALAAGLDVASDATSLSVKARNSCRRNVAGVPHKTVGLFFNCLRKDSDKRNLNPDRDKNVPADSLERLWETIEVPTLDEGFDAIYDIIVI